MDAIITAALIIFGAPAAADVLLPDERPAYMQSYEPQQPLQSHSVKPDK